MGVRIEVEEGTTVRAAARHEGIEIESICGEKATCGKCKVVVQRGDFAKDNVVSQSNHLSPMGSDEQAYWARRRKGQSNDVVEYRLSCQAQVCGDVVIMVPEDSRGVQQVVRKSATERQILVRPVVRNYYLEMEPALLESPQADWERVKDALAEVELLTRGPNDAPIDFDKLTIDLFALRALQNTIRQDEWNVTVTVRNGQEVVRVEPGYSGQAVGLAIDIGTTTIVGHLCDLHTGELLASEAIMNPQVGYGEDIMSRMSFATEEENGLETLQETILESLNKLARKVARQAGLKALEIIELVIVGNTTMHHLLLGLDTKALSRAPYVAALHDALDIKASDLGLTTVNQGAYVHLLPIVASFVGADTMAVLLAEAPHEQDEQWLIVDIGTNAELVLGNRDRLICTSTPTGPAFEGAHIEYGMRAAEGAIEQVEIDSGTQVPRFKVIGSDIWSDAEGLETPLARGICGSGIIDAVAEMYRVGLLTSDGKFNREAKSPNMRWEDDGPTFVLAESHQTTIGREIPITPQDVRQIQLAKAPLYVAAQYLLASFGIETPDRVVLAGGFGNHIDPAKAMLLGMIPDCPLDKVHAVGNAAGDGARIALLNRNKRQEAKKLLHHIERIALPAQTDFQDQFMLALYLPHMTDLYPHLDGIAPSREKSAMAERLFGKEVPQIGKRK